MKSQEQETAEWMNLIESRLNPQELKEAKRVLKILPYNFFFNVAKFTQLRTMYKINLAISLLESEPFEELNKLHGSEILTALLFHDCWEHDGVIIDEMDNLHAYSGSREIRTLANHSNSEFLREVADIVETHEGACLSNIKHPHLLAVPMTFSQKFVYQIVQAVDKVLLPSIAGEFYKVRESSKQDSDKALYDCFKQKLDNMMKHS